MNTLVQTEIDVGTSRKLMNRKVLITISSIAKDKMDALVQIEISVWNQRGRLRNGSNLD